MLLKIVGDLYTEGPANSDQEKNKKTHFFKNKPNFKRLEKAVLG